MGSVGAPEYLQFVENILNMSSGRECPVIRLSLDYLISSCLFDNVRHLFLKLSVVFHYLSSTYELH